MTNPFPNDSPGFNAPILDLSDNSKWEFRESLNLIGQSSVAVNEPFIEPIFFNSTFTSSVILIQSVSQQSNIKWLGTFLQYAVIDHESIGQAILTSRSVYLGARILIFKENVISRYKLKINFNKNLSNVIVRVFEYNLGN